MEEDDVDATVRLRGGRVHPGNYARPRDRHRGVDQAAGRTVREATLVTLTTAHT